MLPAGVPVHRALAVVGRDNPDPRMTRAAASMQQRLEQGAPFSLAMSEHSRLFNSFQVGLVKVGEDTGKLDEVLNWLAGYEEKTRQLEMKFRSALTYPLLVSGLALFFMIASPPLVFRLLTPLLADHPGEVPLLTRAYLALCTAICHPLSWLVGLALGMGVWRLGNKAWADPETRYRWSALFLKAGPLGRFLHTYSLSRFARSLGIQLEAGCSMLRALPLAAQVSGNPVLIHDIPVALRALAHGMTLQRSLQTTGYFPSSFLAYLSAAEECGGFARDFQQMADFYDSDLENIAKSFASVLEPLVMMALGVSAALMIFAVTLPMLQIVQRLC